MRHSFSSKLLREKTREFVLDRIAVVGKSVVLFGWSRDGNGTINNNKKKIENTRSFATDESQLSNRITKTRPTRTLKYQGRREKIQHNGSESKTKPKQKRNLEKRTGRGVQYEAQETKSTKNASKPRQEGGKKSIVGGEDRLSSLHARTHIHTHTPPSVPPSIKMF